MRVASRVIDLAGEALRRVDARCRPRCRRAAATHSRGSVSSRRAMPVLDLRGVAAELLAERHRRRVHQVRAARTSPRARTRAASCAAPCASFSSAGSSSLGDRARGREVHRGREHVVRRLRHVHVSFGCTGAPSRALARPAMTSFAFMFDDVPEPVWNTSIGNCVVRAPPTTSSAAAAMRRRPSVDLRTSVEPRSTCAASRLDQRQRADRGARSIGPPGDREVLDRPLGLRAPQGVAAGTRTSPIESCSTR